MSTSPMPTITINNHTHTVPGGISVLHALHYVGLDVPTLCHDERLKPIGGCRLCLVQVDSSEKPVTACNTPVADHMVITTHTPELEDERRVLLTWIAHHYPPDAVAAYPGKPFHRLLQQYGIIAQGKIVDSEHAPFVDHTHPHLRVDMQRCVLCYRCVHICADVQGQFVWHALGRGGHTHIVPGNAASLLQSDCTSCGACADTCPSGAIEDRFSQDASTPQHWTKTVCPYCGVAPVARWSWARVTTAWWRHGQCSTHR